MRSLPLTIFLAGPLAALAASVEPPAAAGDPLRAPPCVRALEALQMQEAAAEAARPAAPPGPASAGARQADPRLEAARRAAASACLRSRADPAAVRQPDARLPDVRQPGVQPPIALQPLPTTRPPRTLSTPRPTPSPVTRPPDRPRVVTTCDAIGCWADDGSRLDRVGPNLRGPRGLCTLQGTLLSCP